MEKKGPPRPAKSSSQPRASNSRSTTPALRQTNSIPKAPLVHGKKTPSIQDNRLIEPKRTRNDSPGPQEKRNQPLVPQRSSSEANTSKLIPQQKPLGEKVSPKGIIMLDAKTSTPKMMPCTCPDTVFYRVGQEVGQETRHSEFKSSLMFSDVGRYVCSFLNNEGGVLYIGVNDYGRVIGISMAPHMEQGIVADMHKTIARIRPEVSKSEYTINLVKVKDSYGVVNKLKVIELCVVPRTPTPDSSPVYCFQGAKYVRHEASVRVTD